MCTEFKNKYLKRQTFKLDLICSMLVMIVSGTKNMHKLHCVNYIIVDKLNYNM